MQKLGLPSMKSLDRFKTLSSVSGAPKTFSLSSRPPPDSISLGSFTNLKLTAEKLVKEQASVKTDLEMANSKLKKSMEHISVLEEKLQNAFNENAKLKVKQKEDEKLWKGLESKFSSTKTLCDQLTETLQHLASQVQKAEKDKEFFEGKLSQSSKAIDSLNEHMDGLSLKLSSAEETIRNRRKEIEELKFEKEENDRFYNDEQCKTTNLIEEKVQQERDLAVKHSQKKYEQLHDRFLYITSERDALQLVNQELKSKIIELQKAQESVMAQLSEECNLAGERIQKLESEAESLVSKKIETEKLVSKLEEKIDTLSESLRSSENKMQDLLLKMSALEMENRDNTEKMQAEIQGKIEEIANLEKECEKHEVQLDSLEKHVSQLQVMLEEKEQLILQYKERETKLEDQISENQAKLTAAESKLVEARKQYDMMLESNQLELSRHLKEISQRNDQAINDIRRKYDLEKQEIVKLEKEKADKVVEEMEQKCDQKVAECKEELRLHLLRIQEENAALVTCLQQEHDRKELNLKADNHEELKRAQLQAENEFREKTTSLRNEHEVQMKALRCLFEDECRKLQEELSLQKSKEDRQRALLQLQWKVMGDKPQEEQEVNSKKDYSISSIKKRDSGVSKRTQHALARPENGEKESPSPGATQTPVSKLLKKVENANTGSVMSIPKHHKKFYLMAWQVTHHEYEVETSNGRTITKRRKTRTVLFEDPRKHKKVRTPKVNTPRSFVKGTKGSHPNASNIGDLFSEGSLNPYADDPYAFD
ncbi:synaptonemal complex protein 1-like isoform X5 [Durio zibethinus]|uniref:Synaptonemal complex protein 1-like isoform X5 n=1 Tax=Durio zibethinus TaxID=66656 RepID=A0A6P6B7J5_DURZI|nr:synaptonemal complex protein 1-like isoform X5 [Durio zibethinus]